MDSGEKFLILLTLLILAQGVLYLAILRTRRKLHEEQTRSEDPLTGALSFSKFEKILDEELRRGGRYRYPVSLCLLDLDQFKAFNKQMGPKRGDEALRRFYQILKSTSRCADRIARGKNDSFWILLPHTDQTRAERFLARVQQEVDKNLSLDFCAGVVHFQAGENTAQLLKHAETALIQAKGEGGRTIRHGSSEIPAALHL